MKLSASARPIVIAKQDLAGKEDGQLRVIGQVTERKIIARILDRLKLRRPNAPHPRATPLAAQLVQRVTFTLEP